MKDEAQAREVLEALGRRGFTEAEVYLKTGRSRRFEIGVLGRIGGFSSEQGWAVRAGERRGSFFAAGTGLPTAAGPWPEPEGRPLRLPGVAPVPPMREPEDLEAALVSEVEAISLLEGVERSLAGEIPGARLLHAALEDGCSEHRLFNSRGVTVSWRSRAASLQLQAAGPRPESVLVPLLLAERETRRFAPAKLARRLANFLWMRRGERPSERDRGEMVIAPPVAARLLQGLLPLLVGPGAAAIARSFRDRRGRLAASALSVIDDGRLADGVVQAPVDGEGTPTRRIPLVESGIWRQALLSWRQAATISRRPPGCVRRPSWRDEPRVAPSHLFIAPDPAVPAPQLVASVSRGFYLVEACGSPRFDFGGNRFSLPVCGFTLHRGRAAAPLGLAHLCGSVRSLLQGVQAVARDLSFEPLAGMIGAPSLLITGLELKPAAAASP